MTEAGGTNGSYPAKNRAMLIAIITGFLFPFASGFVIILRTGVLFTLKNIIMIHLGHPELFILYLLPAVGAYLVQVLYKRMLHNQMNFQNIIDKKDEIIRRNVQFAKEIGKGNHVVNIIPEGEQDLLGKSMLALKESLLAADRKESLKKWISEGKNAISDILSRYHNLEELGDQILEHLVKYIDAVQGAIYLYDEEDESLVSLSTYAYHRKENVNQQFKVGQGLIGQCAYEKEFICRSRIPDDYFTISSGLLGEQKPASLLIGPLITNDALQGVVEIAFLSSEIPEQTIDLVKELGVLIARTIHNLRVNQKTENLLLESQKRLNWLLENASGIIAIYRKDLKITYVSPSVIRILGYSPEEYMKDKNFDRLTPEDQERIRELFSMIIKDPSISPSIQYHYTRKDGRQVTLESTFRNMLEDPSVNGIIMSTNDISE
jgi:PAS domain S-box-containing protein